jgi:DNA-binding response OmpR family regulator
MDDSVLVLEVVTAALEASGIEARVASSLDELERVRAAGEPDLYVLDVQMPEAFGDDVGQVLRDVRASKAPIVLFSSLREDVLATRAREAGFEYVSKSAGVGALVDRIRALVAEPQG